MNKFLILIIINILFIDVISQTDSNNSFYKGLKTKKFYSVSSFSIKKNGKYTYEINDKLVNRRTYRRYTKTWKNMEKCCPCILKSYDENNNLLEKSVSCTDCRVGWFETYYENGNYKLIGSYKENHTNNWENIYYRGYCNIPDKQWIYYNRDGDTLYSEFWDNGKFIKQVPEQDSSEIWDIEITYNEKRIDTINIEEIGKIVIIPKYKNTNKKSDISIKLRFNKFEKIFTINSFKEIDIKPLVLQKQNKENNEMYISLSIFNNKKFIKNFNFYIK